MDVPHVRRRLDRWNKLQSSVADTDDTDKGARNNAEPFLANNDRADEDVD
jgi:hypothetical protein